MTDVHIPYAPNPRQMRQPATTAVPTVHS